MTGAAMFLFGVALGIVGGCLITFELALRYKRLYRESVARESLHLMGPLSLYGPLEPGVESTPIADALDFGRWESEMGDR